MEMAIAIPLFLALMFGIVDFGLAVFNWSLVDEATRYGARYAIVSDAECAGVTPNEVTGHPGISCPGADPIVCTGLPPGTGLTDTSPTLVEMQKRRPYIAKENVIITYACSDAGFAEGSRPVLRVTVETVGIQYAFILPSLLGADVTMTIPSFATTRTSEDLYRGP